MAPYCVLNLTTLINLNCTRWTLIDLFGPESAHLVLISHDCTLWIRFVHVSPKWLQLAPIDPGPERLWLALIGPDRSHFATKGPKWD